MAEPWLGKEMLRQVELRLANQAANLAAMEARAVGLVNVCVAGTLALGAVVFAPQASPDMAAGAAVAAVSLMIAGGVLLVALWPRRWGVSGIRAHEVADWHSRPQDHALRAFAVARDGTIERNKVRLDAMGTALRVASAMVWMAPIAGLAGVFASRQPGVLALVDRVAAWLAA